MEKGEQKHLYSCFYFDFINNDSTFLMNKKRNKKKKETKTVEYNAVDDKIRK